MEKSTSAAAPARAQAAPTTVFETMLTSSRQEHRLQQNATELQTEVSARTMATVIGGTQMTVAYRAVCLVGNVGLVQDRQELLLGPKGILFTGVYNSKISLGPRPGLLTQGVPGVPQDPLSPPSGPRAPFSGLTKTR